MAVPTVISISDIIQKDALGFDQVELTLSCGHKTIYAKDIGFSVDDNVWCKFCSNLKRN